MIFVDIDGVQIPLRARTSGTEHRSTSGADDASDGSGNPLLERLDPSDGRRLLALPGELAWASTWMAEADEVITPRIGLPVLLFVDWPGGDEEPPRGDHAPDTLGRTPVRLAR